MKYGHELYLGSVAAAFKVMRDIPPADHMMFVCKSFFDGTLAEAKIVPIDEAMLVGQLGVAFEPIRHQ